MSNPNLITTTAAALAAQLGETESGPRATIWRIVHTIGPERTQAFVTQAQKVEANAQASAAPARHRSRHLCGTRPHQSLPNSPHTQEQHAP
jgi:hypothetical protein